MFRVYSNLVRDIVQASCGRAVGNELIDTLTPGVCRFRTAEFGTTIQIDSDRFRNAPKTADPVR